MTLTPHRPAWGATSEAWWLVSGSTSGIGRAIVERFADAGARVLVNSVRSVDKAQALAASPGH